MNFFSKLFKKKPSAEIPPMPSWETVIEMMYDKDLDSFAQGLVPAFMTSLTKNKGTGFSKIWCLCFLSFNPSRSLR